MKTLLKVKFAWFPVWSTALLMLSMISIYLPVFGGNEQKMTNFPLIIVSEDEEFASSDLGKAMINNLTEQQDGHSIQWKIESSEKNAVQAIKENKAYGALVIPTDFSQSLSILKSDLMAEQTEGKPAEMKILINEGGGQMATSIAANVLESIASSTSSAISVNLKETMVQEGLHVSPLVTSLLDDPIQYSSSNVLGLSTNLNKGMTPFMMVLITSITGLMGAQMIQGYLGGISEGFRKKGYPISGSTLLLTEMLLGILLALLVSSILQLAVFGIFGSAHSTSIWKIFFFTLLCSITMFFLFKMIGLLFGKWGMLVMFPINILGIFASGGAIPLANLPAFHHFFSLFLPTRYMLDGMRSLLFYDGNMQSGLGTALWVISVYLVAFLAVCMIFLIRTTKKESPSKARSLDEQADPTVAL
ncbi:ABC transporter permease [Psychrobacillus glaciei]|uniref:ABC transporter permease n=1 Tax=Psychrobacillus glaciei TaxID=2283160 RepID=A0A5J6SSJ3_9BACI|nr:ABC transporter permease [Psychrobacillus glaciei]QFG00484.1 ABC transporter permease [Psychrobacillus glaciei]